MYSTIAYLYQQKCSVILVDNSGVTLNRGYKTVYTKTLKIHRGVDNTVQFDFINQDQKPVNISGSTFDVNLLNGEGTQLLLSRPLTILHAATGRAKLVVSAEEANTLTGTLLSYSIVKTTGSTTSPVFVDDYADARGTIIVLDSVYPSFAESQVLTVPSPAAGIVRYTSIVETTSTATTFQLWFSNFIGTIIAEGASSLIGPWYSIYTLTHPTSTNASGYLVALGNHSYVRLAITTTSGSVTQIIYR
jgi:hypothetical protein